MAKYFLNLVLKFSFQKLQLFVNVMATENGCFLFARYYFLLKIKDANKDFTPSKQFCRLEHVISLYIVSALSVNQFLY